MTDTRVYGNKRRTIAVGLDSANPFADIEFATADELNALLNISSVVKWDSTDLAMQESDKIDDRVLTDNAGAQRRGFPQFGGSVNLLTPKDLANIVDIAVKAFNLFKTPRTVLWIADRVGPLNSTPFVAGQRINRYKIAVDAKKNQTSGDTSYSYTIKLIPQGDVFPQEIVASSIPLKISTSGHKTSLSLATNKWTWGQAKLGESTVTTQASWKSSNPAVAVVDGRGLVTGLSAGEAKVTASVPGAADSEPITITVSA